MKKFFKSKALKTIVSIVLILALFFTSYFASFKLFSKGNFEIDTKYLSASDSEDGTYYLKKAPTDIAFHIISKSAASPYGYTLTDEDGKKVSAIREKSTSKSFNLLPPKGGYKKGETYTLTLAKDTYFADSDIALARKLVFSIIRDTAESYQFTSTVVESDDVIRLDENGNLLLTNDALSIGDIVFGKNEQDKYAAYKITEILDNNTAAITYPALDEIYSELNIYKEYTWNVDELTSNPDLKATIIDNMRNSNFFASLTETAYADEKPDTNIDLKYTVDREKGTADFEFKITLNPGEKGLFGMKELKNQAVTLEFNISTGLNTFCDIESASEWDISTTITNNFSWSITISAATASWRKDGELETLFKNKDKQSVPKDFHKMVKKISDKLDNIAADATAGELKLFDWDLPIPSIPGLYFSAEIKAFAKLEIAADITLGNTHSVTYVTGIRLLNGTFDCYSLLSKTNKDGTVSFSGKANAKAGVEVEIGATFIDEHIAYVNTDPQVGFYADLYATIPINGQNEGKTDKRLYTYFEGGVYLAINFNASVNLIVKKIDLSNQLVEKKYPVIRLGTKKIALEIRPDQPKVYGVNTTVTPPTIVFEYYDVTSGTNKTETLSNSDLTYYSEDGSELSISNGKLSLPSSAMEGDIDVKASYKHDNGKTYTTTFTVSVSKSVIEGRVSAYDDGDSTPIDKASVKIYEYRDKNNALSTVKTDSSGKFRFTIPAGKYRLKIEADGYHTLNTVQSVENDETKYTEHILLIDENQNGMGSAKGQVSNALDGRGLSNVKIRLRPDWNNTEGDYVEDFTTYTNSSGEYAIEDMPIGYYTVEASLNNYVTAHSNILVLDDNDGRFDFAITPVLSDDEVRIILNWGARPSDLDSHLIGESPSGSDFNVFYSNKVFSYNGTEMANLDTDDTTSYGPETITILEDIHDEYIYAVHDYSNRSSTTSTALSFSGAVIKVFVGSNQVATYNVPTNQAGTYWTVFKIDEDKNIVPVNTISNTKPSK